MSKADELAKEYAEKFFLTVDHQCDVEEAYINLCLKTTKGKKNWKEELKD